MKRNIIILIILVIGLFALISVFCEKRIDLATQPTATSTQSTFAIPTSTPISVSATTTTTNNMNPQDFKNIPPYYLVDRGNGVVETVWNYIPAKKVYRLSGKYIKDEQMYEMILSDEPQKYICDSFVISAGDQYLTEKYRAMISSGKTINHLDSNNRIVINLDLQTTPINLKNRIIASSGEIIISVTEKDLGEREVGPCANVVEIVDVSK